MRKLNILVVAIMILTMLLPMTAFAGETKVLPLMAGQNTQVGTVTVSDDGVNLTVTYDITVGGWFLTQTHLYVGTEAPKSSAPGKFPYQHTDLHATTDTFVVPIVDGTKYYIAAHAVVNNESSNGGIIGYDCPTLEEIAALLPASGMTDVLYPGANSFADLVVSNDGILNGIHPAWCVDTSHDLGGSSLAYFYSSYGPLPDSLVDKPENLDLVNWVINQGFVGQASPLLRPYVAWDVQNAIWNLIDDTPPSCDINCQAIVDAALANGEGFTPDFAAGDVFTFIVVRAGYQTLLGELDVECTPIYEYQSETAWATGTFFFKTGWGSYFIYTP